MSELQAQQPSSVRFRSAARLTEEAMREVTACSLRPRTIFAHVWTALCVCLGLLFLYRACPLVAKYVSRGRRW